METNERLSEIRREWVITKSSLEFSIEDERLLREKLNTAIERRRTLQRKLTDLEIEEKDLLGQIQRPTKSAKETAKVKVGHAVSKSVQEAFSGLSKEEREALVNSLLEGLL